MEELFEHLDRAHVGFTNHGIEIEIFVKVLAQFQVPFASGGTVLDKRLWKRADGICRVNTRIRNALLGSGDHVLYLAIDNATDDKVAATFVRQKSMFFLDRSSRFTPNSGIATEFWFRE